MNSDRSTVTTEGFHGFREVKALTTQDILRMYGEVLDELLQRGVIRTRNAPAGDLAEYLAAIVYQGQLAPNSHKSADILLPDGRTLQVKSRVVGATSRRGTYSFFRSWDFDLAVFILLDATSYDVIQAVEVSSEDARTLCSFSNTVKADRIALRANILGLQSARDVTAKFAATLAAL